ASPGVRQEPDSCSAVRDRPGSAHCGQSRPLRRISKSEASTNWHSRSAAPCPTSPFSEEDVQFYAGEISTKHKAMLNKLPLDRRKTLENPVLEHKITYSHGSL